MATHLANQCSDIHYFDIFSDNSNFVNLADYSRSSLPKINWK